MHSLSPYPASCHHKQTPKPTLILKDSFDLKEKKNYIHGIQHLKSKQNRQADQN